MKREIRIDYNYKQTLPLHHALSDWFALYKGDEKDKKCEVLVALIPKSEYKNRIG